MMFARIEVHGRPSFSEPWGHTSAQVRADLQPQFSARSVLDTNEHLGRRVTLLRGRCGRCGAHTLEVTRTTVARVTCSGAIARSAVRNADTGRTVASRSAPGAHIDWPLLRFLRTR